ncbi:hypothetical protein NDU88_002964 [Pleurodeles waltl]|uniref:Uncharacterized protein n=1 Tax=Pleurodeles waltl TaxID=8319 RepID=A0AAV7QBF3_PLEWA|nr:hypothetical protein NDU88_002964 [Pleurodeles waltl]
MDRRGYLGGSERALAPRGRPPPSPHGTGGAEAPRPIKPKKGLPYISPRGTRGWSHFGHRSSGAARTGSKQTRKDTSAQNQEHFAASPGGSRGPLIRASILR